MKITDVNAYVVVPDYGSDALSDWQWTFVIIDTDEGLRGWEKLPMYRATHPC